MTSDLARRATTSNQCAQFHVQPERSIGEVRVTVDDTLPEDIEEETVSHDLAQQVRRLIAQSGWGRRPLWSDADPVAAAHALAIIDSQAFKDAVAALGCRRDVQLLATADGVLVDVVVDLLYETDKGHVLVGFCFEGDPGAQAGRLALAFTTATRLTLAAVDIVSGTDRVSTRFTDGSTR